MTEAKISDAQEVVERIDARGFKSYPEYKESGIEWLREIPAHWHVAPLKRGFDVQLGKMLQNEPISSSDTLEPYIRAANITWSGIDLNGINEMWFSPSEKSRYALRRRSSDK